MQRLSRFAKALAFPLASLVASACATPSSTLERAPEDADTSALHDELQQLCAHAYGVLIEQREVGSPGVRRGFMASCVIGARGKRVEIGEALWAKRRACMLAGQTPGALRRCVVYDHPILPTPLAPPDRTLSDLDRALAVETCDHIFAIMASEFGGGLISAAEQPEFMQDCIEQFEQTCRDDPLGFEREARCLLSVSSFDDFDRCAPE